MSRLFFATILCATSAAAFAATDDGSMPVKGPYIGGSVTQARFDNSFAINDLDRRNTRWKGALGFRFANPFAVEVDYIDFGKATAPPVLGAGSFSSTAHAIAAYGIGYIPIPYVDLFARVGAARVTSSANDGANIAFDGHDTKFAYGWGAQWRWKSLAVRGEYEKLSTGNIGDLNMVSLGLTYTVPIPGMQ
jgi:hypothetical protein